jgi:hypothetical protein
MKPENQNPLPAKCLYQIIGADGREYGPAEPENLRQWILEKRANGKTLVQVVGNSAWTPLEQIPEFAALISSAPPRLNNPPPLQPAVLPVGKPADTYLIPAILLTLCCCMPLGGVAMFYSAMVGKHNNARNYAAAVEASQKARKWCWIAFIVGALFTIFYSLAIAGLMFSI